MKARARSCGGTRAFTYYLHSASYRAILDPRRAPELGLGGPHDKLTLFPGEGGGAPLELLILPPGPGGGVPVVNAQANVLYEVDPEKLPLLLPTRANILDAEAANPWEAELDQGR